MISQTSPGLCIITDGSMQEELLPPLPLGESHADDFYELLDFDRKKTISLEEGLSEHEASPRGSRSPSFTLTKTFTNDTEPDRPKVLQRIKSGIRKLSSPRSEEEGFFKRPFVPRHRSQLSSTSTSSFSSAVPKRKHSISTTALSSPVVTITDRYFEPSSPAEACSLEFVIKRSDFQSQVDYMDTSELQACLTLLQNAKMDELDAFEVAQLKLKETGWYSDRDLNDLEKRKEEQVAVWDEKMATVERVLSSCSSQSSVVKQSTVPMSPSLKELESRVASMGHKYGG